MTRHGTGASDAIAPSFGPGSCRRHQELARDGGADAEVVGIPTLALDVDTAEDLFVLQDALAATPGHGENTRSLLGRLVRS